MIKALVALVFLTFAAVGLTAVVIHESKPKYYWPPNTEAFGPAFSNGAEVHYSLTGEWPQQNDPR